MRARAPTTLRLLSLAAMAWLLLFSQGLWALADGNDVQADADLNYVFDIDALPQVFIKIPESEWNRLVSLYDRNYRNEEYVRADFYWVKGDEPTQEIKDVGVRVSGNTNRRRPQGGDISDIRPFNFKVDFNQFVDDDAHEFHDQKGIKFKAAGDDPTMIRGVFGLEFMHRFGVWTAPRASFARVQMEIDRGGDVIKRYLGVYRMVENLSKPYLTARFGKHNNDGDLWKGGMSPQTTRWGRPDFLPFADSGKAGEERIDANSWEQSYQPAYALGRAGKHDADEAERQLVAFIDSFDRLQGQAFVDWVRAHMDVSLFLKAMAADVALGQTDGYWVNTNNFNFYFDEDGVLYFIPMDYDNALGTTPPSLLDDSGRGNWREFTKLGNANVPLIGKLLGYPTFLDEYKGYLLALANDGLLDADRNRDIIRGYHRLIGPHVANPTGQYGSISDEPPWWGANPWYRVLGGDANTNFFRVKQRNLRDSLQPGATMDGARLYLRGLDGWDVKPALRFQPGDADRLYQVTADLDAGDYSFKVADADWSAATDFGAWPGSERLSLSIPYGLAQKARVSAVQNLNIRIPESGRYTFRLDTLDPAKPYLAVIRQARACEPDCKEARFKHVYFRGTPNGWQATPMDLVDDHLWRTQATFAETSDRPSRFKLDINGDWTYNFGDTDQACRTEPVCEGTAITRADNGGGSVSDIFVDQPGTYAITFNDDTYQYRFERLEDAGGGQ
jgi:spore coat protein CotH